MQNFKKLSLNLDVNMSLDILNEFFMISSGKDFDGIQVIRCTIWYQMFKNGVRMVGQNTILTS